MSEQEEKKNEGEETATDLAPRGETLPCETPPEASNENPEPIREEETATVRYRPRTARLRIAGVAIAILTVLAAILCCCLLAPRSAGGAGNETGDTTASENGGETEGEVRDLYEFDPTLVPEGHVAIRPMDLSGGDEAIVNRTHHTLDLDELRNRYTVTDGEDPSFSEPLVLILHTHTTEGYSADGAISWDGSGELARSLDTAENIIAVGAALTEALNNAGIPTLHCADFHDVDENGVGTYSGSYERAKETVERYLAEHPSIKYVIDLHRDAVTDEGGNIIRAVTEVDGKSTAQVMAVVGSGEGYDWTSNLALALALTNTLNGASPSICRAPMLKASTLNQELAAHTLTLEIGTAGNSLTEAVNAATPLSEALARVIRSVEGGA